MWCQNPVISNAFKSYYDFDTDLQKQWDKLSAILVQNEKIINLSINSKYLVYLF